MGVSFRLNTAVWNDINRTLHQLDSPDVQVGIFDGEVALIAMVHEFGSPARNIPERSFIRSTMRDREADISAFVGRLIAACIERRITVANAKALLGMFLVNAIKFKISGGSSIPPPLATATIIRKGSARALVDTGRMVNSITWRLADSGPSAAGVR